MDFRILGPLEVRDGDRLVEITAPRQRALLVALLLHANQAVPAERLIDLLWGQTPPERAKAALHAYVHRLRQLLNGSGGGGGAGAPLRTRGSGYLLEVPPTGVDLQRFQQLAAEGRKALAAGGLEEGVARLRDALALWRGPALADIAAERLQAQALRLEEERLRVLEERIEAELELGRHAELIGELSSLVTEHPLREQLHGQLMLALYRSGRRAEALEAYRRARVALVEELGIEPGADLQRLQRQILAADPALSVAPPDRAVTAGPAAGPGDGGTTLVPLRQLPADITTFTGRDQELRSLEELLGASGAVGPVVITAIDGTGGIGKSALAIHAAHRLAERFPDGQLYVNLQGATAGLPPLEPLEVLGRFLRALDQTGRDIPASLSLEEAAARFRSQVAQRRLLVVLDNARDAVQVRPLLPGSPSCGVLITSRQALVSLEGAAALHLDVLSHEQAVTLLGRIAGQERVGAEPQAAAAVARWCGYLPLAIQIAGARLTARPSWPVSVLAQRLADATRRLEELQAGELAVRASFDVSVQILRESTDPLDRAAAAAFGRLSLPDGPDLEVAAAARLLDQPEPLAEMLLERLVDAQLLETPTSGRYQFHDLVRLYAREHAALQEPEPGRVAALERLWRYQLATARRASQLIQPGDRRRGRGADLALAHPLGDRRGALAWLEAERVNLLAAAAQAASRTDALATIAVQFAHALFWFLEIRTYWQDWEDLNRLALQVARRSGDRQGEGQLLSDLGVAKWRRHQLDAAIECFQQALAIRRRIEDRHGEAATLNNLGIVYWQLQRFVQAIACYQRALLIQREIGDRRNEAMTLANLGLAWDRLDRFDMAIACYQQALAIHREVGDRHGEGMTLANLGETQRRAGQISQAVVSCEQGLTISREVGARWVEAGTLRRLGSALADLGQHERARALWRDALAIFEEVDPSGADEVRVLLGS